MSQTKRYLLVYGKGGIGKTTLATNLAMALNELGQKVLLVGCSPKSSLMDVYTDAAMSASIMDLIRRRSLDKDNIGNAVFKTEEGVFLMEVGGPEPGIGCAGQGLVTGLTAFAKCAQAVPGLTDVAYTIYDIIGDVVCGGFAMPMRGEGRRDILIVTSGELMSLYAANNILQSVTRISKSGVYDIRVAGYVGNLRGVPHEREILANFSQMTGIPFLAYIPRDEETLEAAQKKGKTVVQVSPASPIAEIFSKLAQEVHTTEAKWCPKPVENFQELFEMFMKFQAKDVAQAGTQEENQAYLRAVPSSITAREKPKRIAIYGTGGVGKSTVAANVSAALVLLGERVYQIGCDPKRDSIATLCGELKPTVLDEVRKRGTKPLDLKGMKELVFEARGYQGRLYGTESGGPSPGRGCAGKGVDIALNYVKSLGIFKEYDFTFIIYDVLGDTVCGGFATPLRFVQEAYIVTNGEIASLVQAMKIAQSIQAMNKLGVDVKIGGIIDNQRGGMREAELVEACFSRVELPVIHHIPRSSIVQQAENLRRTVVQAFPDSEQAFHYIELARKILENPTCTLPSVEILSRAQVQEVANSLYSQV